MLILTALAVGLNLLVRNNSFYWDTVQLASKHAHFFYENGFSSFILPPEIDSGHPPTFGALLAFCWMTFGKTLAVSHLMILPFSVGILWLAYSIGKYYLGEWAVAFPILCFLDPTLSAQTILVSPDVLVIFFFLLCWYSIIYDREKLLAAGVMALGMLSMRGMMIGFALFIFSLFRKTKEPANINHVLNKLAPFIPGGALALGFLIAHYSITGWIGYHDDSPWADSFASVSIGGFFKNIGILIWRYIDFGRLFIYGSTWLMLLQIPFSVKPKLWEAMSLVAILELVLVPSMLLHEGLLGHRYLLPIFTAINLLFCVCLFQFENIKKKFLWLSVAGMFLVTGNLWIYPKNIAQGWDASLAHLPFYKLRDKMINYIDEEALNYTEIGTVFPQKGSFELYDLNERKEGFVELDFEKNKYILYSTIMNDFSDEQLELLENTWEVKRKFASGGIEVILYQR